MTTTLVDRITQTIAIARDIDRRGTSFIKQGEKLKKKSRELVETLVASNKEIKAQFPLLPNKERQLLKHGGELKIKALDKKESMLIGATERDCRG